MPELGPYGSVRGARGNSRPYRESRRRSGQTDAIDPTISDMGIAGHRPTFAI